MSVSASSQGNILAFTIQIQGSPQATKVLRELANEAKRTAQTFNPVFRGGSGVSAFGSLPSGAFSRHSIGGSNARERDFRRAEDQQLKAMFQGRERAQRERDREEDLSRRQAMADERRARAQKEAIELRRAREAVKEDLALAKELADGRRKAQREAIAEERRVRRESLIESRRAKQAADREEIRLVREAMREEQQSRAYTASRVSDWDRRNAAGGSLGGAATGAYGRGGLPADLARAFLPDHYVRSAFRVEDAIYAFSAMRGGVGAGRGLFGLLGPSRRAAQVAALQSDAMLGMGTAAASGMAAKGATGLGLGATASAFAVPAGLAALAVGAGAGAYGIHQGMTRGHVYGGAYDRIGTGAINAGKWLYRATGQQRGDFREEELEKRLKMAKEQMADAHLRQGFASREWMAKTGFDKDQPIGSYSSLRNQFILPAFGLRQGTMAALNEQLTGKGISGDVINSLSRNTQLLADTQKKLGEAKGNRESETALKEMMASLREQRMSLIQGAAGSTSEALHTIRAQENIARGDTRSAKLNFGLAERGDQMRFLRINERIRAGGIESVTRQDLAYLASSGMATPDVLEKLQKETLRRADQFGFKTVEKGMAPELAGFRNKDQELTAGLADFAKQAGINVDPKAGMKGVTDVLVKELQELEKKRNAAMVEAITDAFKTLQENGRVEKEKTKTENQQSSVLRRANNSALFS